jgi:hypothetical protein
MTHDAFDLRPDPELGHLLREHLAGSDPATFGARLRAAVVAARPASPWDVLAGWAWPGLAAAALLLLTLAALLGRALAGSGSLDAIDPAAGPAALIAAANSPSPDVVLGAALEGP